MFFSCVEDKSNSLENDISKENWISPSGYELASNEAELRELIIPDDFDEQNVNFVVDNIKYFEKNGNSVAVVNCYINNDFYSVLSFLKLEENTVLLTDKHGVELVKSEDNSKPNFSQENTLELRDVGPPGNDPPSMACFGKECCEWEKISLGEYNCGCKEEDPSTNIIVTTSDGCKIRI